MVMALAFGASWADMPARATWWGHHGPAIFVSVIGGMVVLSLQPVPYPTGVRPLVSVVVASILIATWLQMRKHDRALCERCVADFPLNPAQSAVTYRRRLAMVHLLAERRAATWYLVAILVACLLPPLVPAEFRVPALAVWLTALGSLAYLLLSGVTHRRLQPWCPQCGPQGGSDKVEAPEPTPLDSLSG
jgi:hypothetical protein